MPSNSGYRDTLCMTVKGQKPVTVKHSMCISLAPSERKLTRVIDIRPVDDGRGVFAEAVDGRYLLDQSLALPCLIRARRQEEFADTPCGGSAVAAARPFLQCRLRVVSISVFSAPEYASRDNSPTPERRGRPREAWSWSRMIAW